MRRWLSLCRLLSAAYMLGEVIGYLLHRYATRRQVNRFRTATLTVLCLTASMGVAFIAAAPGAMSRGFDCTRQVHTTHAYRNMNEGAQRYDWSLRIINQHCVSPTTYFDDIVELRVRGELDVGNPTCDGDVIGGWKTYTADVGRLGARDPDEVTWNCTSSHSWSFTWDYPANDNLKLGAGDRCVGAHVRWVRPIYNDAADDIPAVCF